MEFLFKDFFLFQDVGYFSWRVTCTLVHIVSFSYNRLVWPCDECEKKTLMFLEWMQFPFESRLKLVLNDPLHSIKSFQLKTLMSFI